MLRILDDPRRRFALFWIAPIVLMVGWRIAPLATGERTLFVRDVMNSHLALRAYLGEALRRGELPLIDPLRAGGQALLGNPNTVALYPDNLLLLVGSTLWQLNAHFWLHWLAAFATMFWLGRAWGLGREGAWTAATIYALSGYFVSQLNLYNAVAGVALAPALAAALLDAAHPERRRRATALFGLVWALELVAGDPVLALLALGAAVALALPRRRELPWGALALAFAAGTLLAAPQWVETLAILRGSFRGFLAHDAGAQRFASPDLRALVELLVPLFYGRPDLSRSWSNSYFGGYPPLYYSLAPGVLALALAAVGVRGRWPARGATLALFAAGGLLAYSGGAAGMLIGLLPGGDLFRLSVKFALWAALAGSLLAGRGLERAWEERETRQRLWRALIIVALAEAALFLLFAVPGNLLEQPFRSLFAAILSEAQWADLRYGWALAALIALVVTVASATGVRVWGSRPAVWGALLLALHSGAQLVQTAPLMPTDESAVYRKPPALLAELPPGAVLVHGGFMNLFGKGLGANAPWPDGRTLWLQRRGHEELYGPAALVAGRRMELNVSPEGLDAFLVQVLANVLGQRTDVERVRALAATGVDRLILPRPLAAEVGAAATVELTREEEPALWVYAIAGALEDVQLAGVVNYAPTGTEAFARVVDTEFDPRGMAVVAGEGAPRSGPRGTARAIRFAAEEIEVEAESRAGGVLVVRRAWLPIWRATIDGQAAHPVVANLTRLALELPPGAHTVRFWVDRTPFRISLALAALGALLVARQAFARKSR